MDLGRPVRAITRRFPSAGYIFIPALKLMDTLRGGLRHKELEASVDSFCTDEQRRDRRYMRRLRRDLWFSFVVFWCPFNEYFLFDYPRLSNAGRREFVTDFERDYYGERITTEPMRQLFRDKWRTYETFREYYKRDAVKLDKDAEYEDFRRFVDAHPRFLAKPIEGSGGHGIRVCDAGGADLPALFDELCAENVIAEEIIAQSASMAAPHPASVNTVRAATFVKDGIPAILFAFVRFGQGGSIVDNNGSGGLEAMIDIDTGLVTSVGRMSSGEGYYFHPETGEQILGRVIPRWDELCELVRELAMITEQKYVSWDLALTDGGWVIIEANYKGQFAQEADQIGMRARLSPYFGF